MSGASASRFSAPEEVVSKVISTYLLKLQFQLRGRECRPLFAYHVVPVRLGTMLLVTSGSGI
jgi:hypothetical protein